MPIEIGEPRTRAAEESWDVFYESKVPAIAFVERIKLADINTIRVRSL
jgi:hypothetical protein